MVPGGRSHRLGRPPGVRDHDRQRVGARRRAARRGRDLRECIVAHGPERGRGIAGGEARRAHADQHPPRPVEEPFGQRRDPALVQVDLDLLDAFEVAKECYEFVYAATVLPSWLWAPRDGMRWLLGHGEGTGL